LHALSRTGGRRIQRLDTASGSRPAVPRGRRPLQPLAVQELPRRLEDAVRSSGWLNGICRHVETAVIVERGAKRRCDARLRLNRENEATAATVNLLAAIADTGAVGEIGLEERVSCRRGKLHDQDGAVDAFEARAVAQDTGFRGL